MAAQSIDPVVRLTDVFSTLVEEEVPHFPTVARIIRTIPAGQKRRILEALSRLRVLLFVRTRLSRRDAMGITWEQFHGLIASRTHSRRLSTDDADRPVDLLATQGPARIIMSRPADRAPRLDRVLHLVPAAVDLVGTPPGTHQREPTRYSDPTGCWFIIETR
jgi:hypothetical protein